MHGTLSSIGKYLKKSSERKTNSQARAFQTRAPVSPGSLNLLPGGLYKVPSNI